MSKVKRSEMFRAYNIKTGAFLLTYTIGAKSDTELEEIVGNSFIEMAKPYPGANVADMRSGKNCFDWANKLIWKLTPGEMGSFMCLDNPVCFANFSKKSFVHVISNNKKYLNLEKMANNTPTKDPSEGPGTFWDHQLHISMNGTPKSGENITCGVYLPFREVIVLANAFKSILLNKVNEYKVVTYGEEKKPKDSFEDIAF